VRKEAVEQMPCGQVNGKSRTSTRASVTRCHLQENSSATHFPVASRPTWG